MSFLVYFQMQDLKGLDRCEEEKLRIKRGRPSGSELDAAVEANEARRQTYEDSRGIHDQMAGAGRFSRFKDEFRNAFKKGTLETARGTLNSLQKSGHGFAIR